MIMMKGVGKSKIMSTIYDLARKNVQDDAYNPRPSSTLPSPSIFPIHRLDPAQHSSAEQMEAAFQSSICPVFYTSASQLFEVASNHSLLLESQLIKNDLNVSRCDVIIIIVVVVSLLIIIITRIARAPILNKQNQITNR